MGQRDGERRALLTPQAPDLAIVHLRGKKVVQTGGTRREILHRLTRLRAFESLFSILSLHVHESLYTHRLAWLVSTGRSVRLRYRGASEKLAERPEGDETQRHEEGEEKDEETNRAVNLLRPAFVDAVAGAVPAVDVVSPVSPGVQGRVTSHVQRCSSHAPASGSLVLRRLSLQIFKDVRSPANA